MNGTLEDCLLVSVMNEVHSEIKFSSWVSICVRVDITIFETGESDDRWYAYK